MITSGLDGKNDSENSLDIAIRNSLVLNAPLDKQRNHPVRSDLNVYEIIWNSYHSKYPVTAKFLDRLPTVPSNANPKQRTISNTTRDISIRPMILYVTAAVESYDSGSSDYANRLKNPEKFGGRSFLSFDRSKHTRRFSKSNMIKLFPSGTLSLADFRPLCAPFIPDLIHSLVNIIERNVYLQTWDAMFKPLMEEYMQAQIILQQLLKMGNNRKKICDLMLRTPHEILVVVLRIFLSQFRNKPLHFSKTTLMKLLQQPLLDHFLRPNPSIQRIVHEAAIPNCRTELDTLAFLMIHLLHALQYNPDKYECKSLLCNIYGPLLISFAERPLLEQPSVSGAQSEEAAILEVVLSVCDVHFWNHIGMLQIRSAFWLQNVHEMPGDHMRETQSLRSDEETDQRSRIINNRIVSTKFVDSSYVDTNRPESLRSVDAGISSLPTYDEGKSLEIKASPRKTSLEITEDSESSDSPTPLLKVFTIGQSEVKEDKSLGIFRRNQSSQSIHYTFAYPVTMRRSRVLLDELRRYRVERTGPKARY